MFKKLLNAFRKRFKSSLTTENKSEKRRGKKMADVKDVKEEVVEEQKTETAKDSAEKDTKKDVVETKEAEKDSEKKEEVVEEKAEDKEEKEETTEEETAPEVQETEPEGNGIRVEDLVTKDMLADRLSALEAKFEAVLKENEDLKNTVAGMKEKYEDKDFGNVQKSGALGQDKKANDTFAESFEEYAKQFM